MIRNILIALAILPSIFLGLQAALLDRSEKCAGTPLMMGDYGLIGGSYTADAQSAVVGNCSSDLDCQEDYHCDKFFSRCATLPVLKCDTSNNSRECQHLNALKADVAALKAARGPMKVRINQPDGQVKEYDLRD